jgi:HK97 family phage prohead protease
MTGTHMRAFPANIERTGPRTLTGRLVPYGEATDVLDELPDGKLDLYREGFRPGAFGPQANTLERGVIAKIGLIHCHDGGLGYLGPFTALREEADGLYGDVNILRSKANDVEDLLEAGVSELSVEFQLPRANHTETTDDGTRWRTRAHLHQVALEPKGAYSSARVIAYRKEIDERSRVEAEEAQHEVELAEAHRRAEALATETLARRQRFDALAARADAEIEHQRKLVERYGPATRPRGW